jgi:hypothetical protein
MKTQQERMDYVVQYGLEMARKEFHQQVLERRRQELLAANEKKTEKTESAKKQPH